MRTVRAATISDAVTGHPAGLPDRCARSSTLLVAVVAICAAALAGPAQAAPGGDAVIEETTFNVGANAQGGSVATCPAGRRVTGGGIGTTAPTPDGVLRSSAPHDETGTVANTVDGDIARGWQATIFNIGPARDYKVFALCSATSDATVEETPFNAGILGNGVATCPLGKRVVGGGVGASAGTPGGVVRLSGPLDETGATASTIDGDIARSWYTNVDIPGVSQPYKVFALCSATSDATVEETTFNVGANAPGANFATCPAGRRALGGGVGTTSGVSVVQASGPLDDTGATANTADGDAARYWYANVENLGSAAAYKALALCATDDLGGPAGGGGGPGGGGGGPGGAVLRPDVTKPVLSPLALAPRRFRAAGSGPSIAAAVGATVRYTVSEAAAVEFRVERARPGRRVGRKCVKPRRSNRRRRSCTRYVTLPGSFTHQGRAGANSLKFSGRLRGRKLRPGSYRLRAVATDPSRNSSSSSRVRFRIVR